MRPSSLARFLLAALAGLALAGCTGAPDRGEAAGDPLELRVHEVPPGMADDVAMALNDVLGGSERVAGVGKVSRRVGGRLVVTAPASMQDDIEHAIAALKADVGATPLQGPVRLAFWVLETAPDAAPDPRLAPIRPALEQLGDGGWVLVEHMATTALVDGGGGVVDAVRAEAEFQLEAAPDGMRADVTVVSRVPGPEGSVDQYMSRTRDVPVRLDQLVVLHQFLVGSGVSDDPSRSRLVVLQASRPDQD